MKILELACKAKYHQEPNGEVNLIILPDDPEILKETPCNPDHSIIKIAAELSERNNDHLHLTELIAFEEKDPKKLYTVIQERLVE